MCATGVLWYLVLHHCRVITGNRAKGTSMKFSGFAVAVTTLFSVCTAQSLQTAAPAPFAASPLAGVCMSGQPAGQLTNAGTGTVSVTSDVATVGFPFTFTLSNKLICGEGLLWIPRCTSLCALRRR